VVFKPVHHAFAGQDLEGSDLQIVDGGDVPAVPAVGGHETVDHRRPLPSAFTQAVGFDPPGLHPAEHPLLCGQRSRGRGPYRGVLLPKELFGFRRPRQQLRIEYEPVRAQLVP